MLCCRDLRPLGKLHYSSVEMALQVGLLPISALAAADVGSFRIVVYAVVVHAELITNESIMRSEQLMFVQTLGHLFKILYGDFLDHSVVCNPKLVFF